MRGRHVILLLLGALACGDRDEDTGACEATVDAGDPWYERFEGIGSANACEVDADCVIGGCSGEVCAAEAVDTTCEELPTHPEGECGCLDGVCAWQACE